MSLLLPASHVQHERRLIPLRIMRNPQVAVGDSLDVLDPPPRGKPDQVHREACLPELPPFELREEETFLIIKEEQFVQPGHEETLGVDGMEFEVPDYGVYHDAIVDGEGAKQTLSWWQYGSQTPSFCGTLYLVQ